MAPRFDLTHRDALAEIDALERALLELRARVVRQEAPTLSSWAEALYRVRRRRNAIFAEQAELFGEPAWDIMLDLLAAIEHGKTISISSACIAADVSTTTALRYISRLEEMGLVGRSSDGSDRRRSFIHLTDSALHKLLLLQEPDR